MQKNRFAQIMNGTVIYIYETHLPYNKLWEIFDASYTDFFDITSMPEVQLGWRRGLNDVGEMTFLPPLEPETLEDWKELRLEEALIWTNKQIIAGFESDASGEVKWYDSDENDQSTYNITYNSTQSPNFETHPIYKGKVPVRCRSTKDTDSSKKEVVELNKEQYQKLMDDLAVHLGECKIKGWHYQNLINETQDIESLKNLTFI